MKDPCNSCKEQKCMSYCPKKKDYLHWLNKHETNKDKSKYDRKRERDL